jgi:hypothetical protein
MLIPERICRLIVASLASVSMLCATPAPAADRGENGKIVFIANITGVTNFILSIPMVPICLGCPQALPFPGSGPPGREAVVLPTDGGGSSLVRSQRQSLPSRTCRYGRHQGSAAASYLRPVPGEAKYEDMYEVPPGYVIRVSTEGLAKRRYWTLEAREHKDSLRVTIQRPDFRRPRESVRPVAPHAYQDPLLLHTGVTAHAAPPLAQRAFVRLAPRPIPLERPKAALSAILIGRFHYLLSFYGLDWAQALPNAPTVQIAPSR